MHFASLYAKEEDKTPFCSLLGFVFVPICISHQIRHVTSDVCMPFSGMESSLPQYQADFSKKRSILRILYSLYVMTVGTGLQDIITRYMSINCL